MPPLLRRRRRPTIAGALLLLAGALLLGGGAQLCAAHADSPPSCSFHAGDHHHHHDHDHHHHDHRHEIQARKLPEELAEEEDLELYGFGDHGDHGDHHHHHHHHSHGESDPELSPIGLWARAMGCSLLVSMASLVCLIILPVIFMQGKPSKTMVDCLAVFGAGAMLGDAFLHQLPHAFGGEHSHAHEHHSNNTHNHQHESGHSHSLKDLSVGLSILSGIVLFLLVEKIVRYVEDHTRNGVLNLGHGHHHHHKQTHKLKDDDENHDNSNPEVDNSNDTLDIKSGKKHQLQGESDGCLNDKKHTVNKTLPRQRATSSDGKDTNDGNDSEMKMQTSNSKSTFPPPSSLVFGYLNLFSDGVHNFTDGMALGSAFLLHGSIGGWSRTLFLLAHEIPQEVGDFGILVRSGFTVTRALFYNFLSALVALAGTALALLLGKDPGQSSLIEGFTAGGFIYIAVAGVLPEMNSGKTTLKSTSIQLISLTLGMAVALWISLIE